MAFCALGLASLVAGAVAPQGTADALAVLETSCVKCHNSANDKGGLDLSTRDALLKGGDTGPAVVPWQAGASLLLKLVKHDDEPAMPRKANKLSTGEIARISAWIDAGAPYHRPLAAAKEDPPHFAYRPLPAVQPGESVDGHVSAMLASRGLTLNPPASRPALVRRAYFDLVGLPPTPKQVDAFVRDRTAGAWPKLVDDLLASPRHGERWARHWLDVARYADSEGFEGDRDRPNAYHYRDFVIRAFNADMPFDQFVRWQLAGDEYAPDDPEARVATGFLAAGTDSGISPTASREVKERHRYDELDDIVSTAGAAFLGLTVGCARCHDHKYDPLSAREYYGLVAAFATVKRSEASLSPAERAWEAFREAERLAGRERRMAKLNIPEDDRELLRQRRVAFNGPSKKAYDKWDKQLRFNDEALAVELSPEKQATWSALEAAASAAVATGKPDRALMATDAAPEPVPTFVLARGEPRDKIAPIGLVFPAFLGGAADPDAYQRALLEDLPSKPRTTLRRAALAEWLVDADQGAGRLLARVTANRVWHYHFGRGLVETPNDFGTQGDTPVHGALLDFLAAKLIEGGWRLKPLHRLIMTSAVYRQSALSGADRVKRDPDGKLLSRWRVRRLEAEAVRDALLATSGALNTAMFGPGVKPPVPAEAIATRGGKSYPQDAADTSEVWRRSVYLFTKRSVRLPMMEILDGADPTASCGSRFRTTVPTQALAMLNDDFVRARARDFAARLLSQGGASDATADAIIRNAFAAAFGRFPAASEGAAARRFLRDRERALRVDGVNKGGGPDRVRMDATTDLCHALYNTGEFIHVE